MPRERFQRQSLGAVYKSITEARVLLVGAGGIGCELLKNLVQTGFGEIHIIDLDTIDLSNLNRQFLFRHEHIKKPKALVAKEVAQKFNPNVKIVAHHANVKDAQFNIEWFSSFNIVFNALDNLDARRHVNKMCLAADVPLIESGTTGFNGQVQVIRKGKTACYDCTPKETPKTYPVCTIRSTPSQPIHCIVWAKSYLLPELFGVSEDEVPELDTSTDSENAEELKNLKEEAEALKKIRESVGSKNFAQQVFDKVYKEDIERLVKMEDMWKTRKPPTPLSYDLFAAGSEGIDPDVSHSDQRVWSISETFAIFKHSLERLSKRLAEEREEAQKTNTSEPVITFDKDDEDTLDFVTASANLRSAVFNIEPKSKFETKQMAGNIIPAIATTNAIIASLCVLEAFKVMKGDYERTKTIFQSRSNMSATSSDQPNSDCPVCSCAMARLQADPERTTLKDLVDGILVKDLGYGKEFTIVNDNGGLIYDYMDNEDEDGPPANFEKTLADLEVKDGTFLLVKDDEGETPRVDLQLVIETKASDNEESSLKLVHKDDKGLQIPRKEKKSEPEAPSKDESEPKITNGTSHTKRKREADDEGEDETHVVVKKVQQSHPAKVNGDGPITIDDEEGVIEID